MIWNKDSGVIIVFVDMVEIVMGWYESEIGM